MKCTKQTYAQFACLRRAVVVVMAVVVAIAMT